MIYDNQKQTAREIYKSLSKGYRVTQVILPMQSGKTGSMMFLANELLQTDAEEKSVGFICAQAFKDLRLQNIERLSTYLKDGVLVESNIKVIDSELFTSKDKLLKEEIKNLTCLIIDECDYGSSDKGRLWNKVTDILNMNPNIKLVLYSATPYEPLVSDMRVNIIQGQEQNIPGYTGLLYFFNNKKVVDNYGKEASFNNPLFVKTLKEFTDKKYYIVRVKTTNKATELAKELKRYKLKTIIATMETGIKDSLLKLQGVPRFPTVVLVVNGLAAGIDLGAGKRNIWGVWETRRLVSSCAQGLPGRVCSFGATTDVRIYANKTSLLKASEILNDFTNVKKIDNIRLAGRVYQEQIKHAAVKATTEVIDKKEFEKRFGQYFYVDKFGRYRKKYATGPEIQFMMASMSKGGGIKATEADSRLGTKLHLFDDHKQDGYTYRMNMFKRSKALNINDIKVGIFYNDYSNCVRLGLEVTKEQAEESRRDMFIIVTNTNELSNSEGIIGAKNSMYNLIKETEDGKLSAAII